MTMPELSTTAAAAVPIARQSPTAVITLVIGKPFAT